VRPDRNKPGNEGRGKYPILKLRKFAECLGKNHSHCADTGNRVRAAILLLEEEGILDWGREGTEAEFFLIRLKDMFAASALFSYAESAMLHDPEYADEVYALAARSGPENPFCKLPD
jgi:hypothetical protein